jgi:hypothetical protein
MLNRIWTAIVGGVAGIAIGMVMLLVLHMKGVPDEQGLKACWIGGAIGLGLGFVFARPKRPPPKSP